MRIALVGKQAVGRTFVANHLRKQHDFKIMHLHDGVYKFMRYMYGYGKYQRPTWNRRMDLYDAIYKIDPDIHIKYLLRRLDTTVKDVVVDDVRYINEILALKNEGFIIIRVSGPQRGKRRISSTLRDAAAGAIILQESYREDKNSSYSVDYSVYNESRDGTRKSIDQILDIERNKSL